MELKQNVLDKLEDAINSLKTAENMLSPSLGVYKDLHQQRLDLQSFRSDIEDGLYEKNSTDSPSF